jgi:SET family sugar efflux transporter-like MFS transporter
VQPSRYRRVILSWRVGGRPASAVAGTAQGCALISNRKGQTAVLLGCAVGCYGLADAVLCTTTSLFLADAVRAGPLLIGLFFTGRAATGIGVNLAAGWLSDRLRDRRVMLGLGSVAGAVGAVAFMVTRDYVTVFVTGVVFFSLSGVSYPQLFAYATQFAETTGRPVTSFTSAARAAFSAAWVVGPPLGFCLLTRFGFAPMYAATGGLFLAAAVLGRWCLPALRPRPWAGNDPRARRDRRGLPSVLAALPRRTWLLLGAVIALGMADQMYNIGIALYVTMDRHLAAALVGWLAGTCAVLEIPIMITAGRVADRRSKLRVLTAAAVVATVFFCVLPAAGSAPVLLALQLPNAAWIAVALSIPMIMVQQEAPSGLGTSSTLYGSAYMTAALLAGATTGVTAAQIGYGNVFWVCAALCLLGTALLVSRSYASGDGRTST